MFLDDIFNPFGSYKTTSIQPWKSTSRLFDVVDSSLYSHPKSKVLEGDVWQYSFDVPGIEPEDLKVTCESNLLKISGKRSDTDETLSMSYRIEQSRNTDDIEAETRNGVLTLKFKPKEESKHKEIKVLKK